MMMICLLCLILYCSKCRVQLILYSTKGKSINPYVLRLNIVRLLSFLKRRERERQERGRYHFNADVYEELEPT